MGGLSSWEELGTEAPWHSSRSVFYTFPRTNFSCLPRKTPRWDYHFRFRPPWKTLSTLEFQSRYGRSVLLRRSSDEGAGQSHEERVNTNCDDIAPEELSRRVRYVPDCQQTRDTVREYSDIVGVDLAPKMVFKIQKVPKVGKRIVKVNHFQPWYRGPVALVLIQISNETIGDLTM